MKRIPFLSSILFALYPVLFLYSYNLGKVVINQLLLPIGMLFVIIILLLLIFNFFINNIEKTSLLVTTFIIMFFLYGQIYEAIDGSRIGPVNIGWPGYLLPFFTFIYLWIFLIVKKTKAKLENFILFLNSISIVLILFSVFKIVNFEYGKSNNQTINDNIAAFQKVNKSIKINKHPSIYYIILDAYARNDVLKEIYDYNNDNFIGYLTNKGFFVGDSSTANYCQTALSLSSSLNMCYLDSLSHYVGIDSYDRSYLTYLIKNNNVMRFLKNYGYKTIAFSNGYTFTEIDNADLYISPGFSLNEFWNALINFTPINGFINFVNGSNQYTLHGENILFIFEKLKELSEKKYPKFVFAHIVSPHPPFIFGRNGLKREIKSELFSFNDGSHYIKKDPSLKREYIDGYKEQLVFISNKVKEFVDILLKNDKDAVIILQSDHGPGSNLDWNNYYNSDIKERLSILNAIYFPDSTSSSLHDKITPVNTFRILLNRYFNQHLKMLKNESYFSTWPEPYNFIKAKYPNNNLLNQNVK